MSIDDLRREIHEVAHAEGEELHRTAAIFRGFSAMLAEGGFMVNPQWTPLAFKDGPRACAIDGYDIDEDDGLLTVIAVVDCHSSLELDRQWTEMPCPAKAINDIVARLENALDAIVAGRLPKMEDSDPATGMISSLRSDYRPDRGAVACCILTTGRVADTDLPAPITRRLRTAVWDSARIGRLGATGRESLVADFSPLGGLPCLASEAEAAAIADGKTGVLISKISGSFLASFYNEHRMRLLERNVRAFLQFTGKVNKGIRETIETHPERFLSYNNGISVTVSKVRFEKAADGIYRLMQAEDFQIVNGGQTTASIARCAREGVPIANIDVAMKITVVPPALVADLVPQISRFANTQNRIREDDLFANNPWHVALEKHSRSIEANANGQAVYWYYERVRGTYADEVAKHPTIPQKDAFKHRFPTRNRFNKTDLARYLLAWEQEAHTVSLGGQKCFGRLMTVLGATATNADASQLPSEEDFRRMCSLAMMQRHGEAICHELGIAGYRANLVAYAIMLLSVKTGMKFPWLKTWTDQALPAEIDHALRVAIPACNRVIREFAGDRNISEVAKRKECRDVVLAQDVDLGVKPGPDWDRFSIKDMARPKAELELLRVFAKVSASQWLAIAKAAERAGKNEYWSGVAESMATKLIPAAKSPTERQAKLLKKVLARFHNIPAVKGTLSQDDEKILEIQT